MEDKKNAPKKEQEVQQEEQVFEQEITPEDPELPPPPPPNYDELKATLAKVIADARLSRGKSIEDVAYQINIPVPTLTKMENGSAFESMAKVFLRGYLINYAKALELEQEPLLELLNDIYVAKSKTQLNESSVQYLELRSSNQLFTFMIPVTIIVVVLAALIYWKFVISDEPTAVPVVIEDVVPVIPEYLLDKPALDEDPITSQVTTATNEITFTFTEESWLEVIDKSGKEITWQLYGPGQSISFIGTPPYSIVVGNARATLVRYEQQTIDLTRYTEIDNVARLTVPVDQAQ